ncbi:MAG: hypothetical protein HYZ95_01860 [Candidatus Omnitrophica bacterium]|nr:hypothetical protein [Candidatus Omnitrophota bacterium]
MVKVSPRIKAAASLTLAGCMAHLWQVAFMCFGSAAEALLFYQDGPGQTERLRFAYASLVAQDEDQKQILRRDFGRLYKLRCEIVHKGAYWRDDGGTNLGDLAELENLLRRLWRAILDSQTISDALQGDDRIRHALFEQRQGLPPARTRRCCL